MANNPLIKALGAGSILQILMVVVGHYMPDLQQAGLFPIGGTLIGLVTGWLAGKGGAPAAPVASRLQSGAIAGGVAGGIGSLVSTALGDVPLANIAIAAGSTLVTGGLGGWLSKLTSAKAT